MQLNSFLKKKICCNRDNLQSLKYLPFHLVQWLLTTAMDTNFNLGVVFLCNFRFCFYLLRYIGWRRCFLSLPLGISDTALSLHAWVSVYSSMVMWVSAYSFVDSMNFKNSKTCAIVYLLSIVNPSLVHSNGGVFTVLYEEKTDHSLSAGRLVPTIFASLKHHKRCIYGC